MPADEHPVEASGAGDWSFPPVEPVDPVAPSYPPEGLGAPSPAPNFDIPRRNPALAEPVSPLRALAGAGVAVAGVLLGVGALLWATEAPGGDPTLQAGQAKTRDVQVSAPPSPSATASVAASVRPTPGGLVGLPPPSAVVASPSASPVAAPKLALTVLNNSTRPLLADRAARRFRAAGWPIKLTGNFRGRVSATTVYYAPGQRLSALRLQRSFPGLTRVRPRFDGLPGSGLTVVLTRSYDP